MIESKVFASRYQLHLPSEDELVAELRRERRALEAQASDNGQGDEEQ